MNELPAAPVLPLTLGGHAQPLAQIALEGLPSMADPVARAWAVLHQVLDPEVPAVSVVDLGIVREVQHRMVGAPSDGGAAATAENGLAVWLTPTYSGCPATEAIEQAVVQALRSAGFAQVVVEMRRAPAWTTDWISAEGRAKLKAYGIAPPGHLLEHGEGVSPIRVVRRSSLHEPVPVPCPHCDSADTERLSAFGATACKSLWRCRACREPFEHFKPI